MTLKCKTCGGRLQEEFITYEKTILGDKVEIPGILGTRCVNCGKEEVSPEIKERLQVKILEKKLEKQGETAKLVRPLLINKVREVRIKKGVPQSKIGQALRYSEQRFGAIERNDNTPTIYTTLQISEALGIENLKELYELIYIPKELFEKLQTLDENFKEIKGIAEAKKKYEDANNKYEDLRAKEISLTNELQLLKTSIKRNNAKMQKIINKNEKQILKLNENKEENKNEIEKLKQEIAEAKENFCSDEMLVRKEKEISVKIKPIQQEAKEFKAKTRDVLLKKLRTIEKKHGILKQGYCITLSDWERVKEIFKDELKKNAPGITTSEKANNELVTLTPEIGERLKQLGTMGEYLYETNKEKGMTPYEIKILAENYGVSPEFILSGKDEA